ncbi:MAG: Uma2 family endonuclease [Chloroflexaceae bacterium]|nr:Uma2 family endonuclease [Chloroflexaceae bacterium]
MAYPLLKAPPSPLPPPVGEQRFRMSYEEFLAWSDEDTHAEWVNGEVMVFMPPVERHQAVAGFLYSLISLFTDWFDLGVVRFAPFEMRHLPGRSSREPDLLFLAREHLSRLTPERLEGPADLVVEIISPSSAFRDRVEKFAEYQEAGVPEYWTIDPRPTHQQATFYQCSAAGRYEEVGTDAAGRYHALVLPGFWLDPAWLWQEPLPNPTTMFLAPEAVQSLREAMSGKNPATPPE